VAHPADRKLRIYSDRTQLAPGVNHVTMLTAFWGREPQLSSWPGYADDLIAHGHQFLELSELDDADLAVYPRDLMRVLNAPDGADRIAAFGDAAHAEGKPAVYFFHTDRVEPLGLDGDFVFRTSLNRRVRAADEYAIPGFHEDLLAEWHGGRESIRRRDGRARVSFCGGVVRPSTPRGVASLTRRLAGQTRQRIAAARGQPDEADLYARASAIDALKGQRHVETDIVIRSGSAGGAWDGPPGTLDVELWNRVRREYVRSMLDADYVLCVRGAGNWSYRFTEALSLGRIPVVVDTDCVLPYDFLLDWRDHIVWVDRDDIPRIGEVVADLHESLTDGEFVDRQRACRCVWQEYLSPLGFFRNFHRHFEVGLLATADVEQVRSRHPAAVAEPRP